jgi:hypothetical protein
MNQRRRLVLAKFENAMTNMVGAIKRYECRGYVQEAFRKIRTNHEIALQYDSCR